MSLRIKGCGKKFRHWKNFTIAAHLSGGLVSVMFGLVVVNNFTKYKKENIITCVVISVYVVAMALAVVFNAKTNIY